MSDKRDDGAFRKCTDAENMECLIARHSDKFSPAEKREADNILRRLKALDEAVVPEPVDYCEFSPSFDPDYSGPTQWVSQYDYDALKLHAQQSAEAARVVREELERTQQDVADAWMSQQRQVELVAAAESRLREVEARTVDEIDAKQLAAACEYLEERNWPDMAVATVISHLVTIRNRPRALPSSTDTEEK